VIQAKRLFARIDVLREKIDQDDPAWGPTLEAGVAVLNACGDLPDDDFWRDAVLAILELNALIWRTRGGCQGFDGSAGCSRTSDQ